MTSVHVSSKFFPFGSNYVHDTTKIYILQMFFYFFISPLRHFVPPPLEGRVNPSALRAPPLSGEAAKQVGWHLPFQGRL